MGMNYYKRTVKCDCCGEIENLHIGKSSFGWTFNFMGTEKIRSFADWKIELKDSDIYNPLFF